MNLRGMLGATQQGLGSDAAKSTAAKSTAAKSTAAKSTAAESTAAKSNGHAEVPPAPTGVQRMLAATQRGLGKLVGSQSAQPAVASPVRSLAEPDAEASPSSAKTTETASAMGASDAFRLVMSTGLYKTAAGVVGQRLFKEHAENLRTYLTIQLRGTEAAQQALVTLEEAIELGTASQLEKGPSKRAAIFLAARNQIEYERMFGEGPPPPLHAVPWEPTPPGRPDGWGRALDEIRFGLGPDEAELLMLRHVCGLTQADLAYVLGVEKTEASRRIEAGAGFARILLEDVTVDAPDLEAVLRDAFRVEPPTTAELAAAARPKVVPLPAGTLIGDRYEVEGTIGGGEFAFVYRARDVRVPGHVVALKLLHQKARTAAAREGAIRELSLIASAFHYSLVQFKDHGWYEERLWFVMPFYAGEMLLDRIGRGPLELDEALGHFERLARALAALHAAGIRHQDVKPENIFLVELRTGATVEKPEVLPMLLDLGVASPNGELALAGTPMYFPPEVAGRIVDEGCETPLTPKADVFALALSLLHSIETPDVSELQDVDVDTFLQRRALSVPKGPTDPALKALRPHFLRWLAHEPKDRPTAGELADEIAAVRAELGTGGGASRRAAPKGLRGLLVALAMGVVLAVLATSADAPSRTVQIVEGGAPASVTAPADESERVRLLRHRLDTEERRGAALEDELSRLRRRQLGLDEASADETRPETAEE